MLKRVLLCADQVSEEILFVMLQFLCRQWWRGNSEMMLHDCFTGARLHEESTHCHNDKKNPITKMRLLNEILFVTVIPLRKSIRYREVYVAILMNP